MALGAMALGQWPWGSCLGRESISPIQFERERERGKERERERERERKRRDLQKKRERNRESQIRERRSNKTGRGGLRHLGLGT